MSRTYIHSSYWRCPVGKSYVIPNSRNHGIEAALRQQRGCLQDRSNNDNACDAATALIALKTSWSSPFLSFSERPQERDELLALFGIELEAAFERTLL